MVDQGPRLPQELAPFDPNAEIRKSDIRLAARIVNESARYGGINPCLARDIIVCSPRTRAFLRIPPVVVTGAVAGIVKDAQDVSSMPDLEWVLGRASALKQLVPNLDIQTFNAKLPFPYGGELFLDQTRETLLRAIEKARGTGQAFFSPLRNNPEVIADFNTLTDGTPLVIPLNEQDRQGSVVYFDRLAKNSSPMFSTRGEWVEHALTVGAAIRTLFPQIPLEVEPSFWGEVRQLLYKKRNLFSHSLPGYLEAARKATILAGIKT